MSRVSLACSFLVVALLCSRCVRVESTPLDDYVNKPDPTYKYEDLGNPWKGDGYTSYFINLTSQTWLSGMHKLKCSSILLDQMYRAKHRYLERSLG